MRIKAIIDTRSGACKGKATVIRARFITSRWRMPSYIWIYRRVRDHYNLPASRIQTEFAASTSHNGFIVIRIPVRHTNNRRAIPIALDSAPLRRSLSLFLSFALSLCFAHTDALRYENNNVRPVAWMVTVHIFKLVISAM